MNRRQFLAGLACAAVVPALPDPRQWLPETLEFDSGIAPHIAYDTGAVWGRVAAIIGSVDGTGEVHFDVVEFKEAMTWRTGHEGSFTMYHPETVGLEVGSLIKLEGFHGLS
jgi:hypothetical protein